MEFSGTNLSDEPSFFLFSVLLMFMFTNPYWLDHKDRFVQSDKIEESILRNAGRSEMTDHRILSKDRTVQQTKFSGGTVVIVNFGKADFKMPNDTIISVSKVVQK